ncbi:MAG: GEVED domain-containing protein [Gemmataceae bacterium]
MSTPLRQHRLRSPQPALPGHERPRLKARPFLEILEDRPAPAVLLDFGDAPDPTYPTLVASNGASHIIAVPTNPTLGATITSEADGQPNATATGDSDDGITFLSPFVANGTAAIRVNVQNAPSGAKLDAWIDWNHDGDWNDGGEQIATSLAVVNGNNTLTLNVPAAASVASATNTFARFRLSSAGGLATTGQAADGEVEDYQLQLSSAPTTVYVSPEYAGSTPGDDVIGPATAFGYDAFTSIQQAINVVATGGTVIVAGGTFHEHLTIAKALTLHSGSHSGNFLDGDGGGTALTISAANVIVEGFTIQNFTTGVSASNLANLTLTDLNLTANGSGGTLTNITTLNFEGWAFTDNLVVSATQIWNGSGNRINYTGVANLNLYGLGDADTIGVQGFAGTALNVFGNDGGDEIDVGVTSGQLGAVLPPTFNIDGGTAHNTLNLNELADTLGDTIILKATQVLGRGAQPFTINVAQSPDLVSSFAVNLDTGDGADLVSVEDIPGISGPTRNGSSLSINTRNGDDRIGVFVQDHMTVNLEAGTGANQVEFTRAPHSESVQLSTGALTAFPTGPGIHFPNFQINYKASFGGSFKAVVLSAQGDVLVIGSSAPVFITGGPGADNFSLSAFGANLGAVLGSYVTIDGLGGANSLTISETDAQTGDVVTVLPTQILGEGPQPFVVNYSATGGSFAGGITIKNGVSDDWVRVRGTPAGAPVTVNTNAGNDHIDVAATSGPLGVALGGAVNIDAGPGANQLFVDEANNSGGDVVTLLANQILGEGPFPFTINFNATNGSFAGLWLTTGTSDDWLRVRGVPAGVPVRVQTGAGNDLMDVSVSSSSHYENLFLDGGSGANSIHVIDQTGGAQILTGINLGVGFCLVSYGSVSTYFLFQNVPLNNVH